ncbi:hypothetical protein AAEP80_10200 [Curtobacterium sp. L3-7]|uniref:hypothetical protein n=1 Tax=Curtobacterium sp. L3-7 TaxID=3138787 RepID=UPI003B523E09
MTTPFVDGAADQEARPASAASAPVPETVESTPPQIVAASTPAPSSAPDAAAVLDPDAVAPDYPPVEEHLPPAPTSPTVHTVPFDQLVAESPAPVSTAPVPTAPVSPVDAPVLVGAPATRPTAPAGPVVPQAGQPRFSVPGLEHVVVAGTEPPPVGPVGYRTPARFAHQQVTRALPITEAPAPADLAPAVLAPAAGPAAAPAPVVTGAPEATRAATRDEPEATVDAQAEPSLPSDAEATTKRTARRPLGATPGGILGAVAGIAALGLAAWWFLAPASVHAAGVAIGALGVVLSIATLRNPAATWQRPVALLGAVLGGVGTLALLWAVATAVLPMAGVTLPDLTGSGLTPTLVP